MEEGRQDEAAERLVRVAAAGDFHFDGSRRGELVDLFAEMERAADVLVLCGDMTTHGTADQIRAFVEELRGVESPIVAVLGNHDHESGSAEELFGIMADRGIHVLDGTSTTVQGVGFAGVKGFAGGFGRHSLGPFGEAPIKAFVQEAVAEALKLERALMELKTPSKVVVMHYAPIPDTLVGEPEAVFAFLGSSRLLPPIETFEATVVLHGHAHAGRLRAETPQGVPVHNVALPVLAKAGERFALVEVPAADRRRQRTA